MADNYLEKKFEEFKSGSRPAVRRTGASLDTLLLRTRSCRGYDKSYEVKMLQLERIAGVCTKVASGRNQQVLRFRLITKGEQADTVLSNIKLGAALSELHLPFPGTEPEAFIVVCSEAEETRFVDIDLGIALQSMQLKATEMGLASIIICAFDKEKVRRELDLPMDPLAILAVGRGSERIEIISVKAGSDLRYYRNGGVHYVPKINFKDLLI